jgi:hypothetical protein
MNDEICNRKTSSQKQLGAPGPSRDTARPRSPKRSIISSTSTLSISLLGSNRHLSELVSRLYQATIVDLHSVKSVAGKHL